MKSCTFNPKKFLMKTRREKQKERKLAKKKKTAKKKILKKRAIIREEAKVDKEIDAIKFNARTRIKPYRKQKSNET